VWRKYSAWVLVLVACEIALAVFGVVRGDWWLVVGAGGTATCAVLVQRDKRKRGLR
jgi:hypothetical protein